MEEGMNRQPLRYRGYFLERGFRWPLVVLILSLSVFAATDGEAFTLSVVDQNGAPVSGFRWLVEEDTTLAVTPGEAVSDSIAVNIHSSYAPVVAEGHEPGNVTVVNIPSTQRYMVSVLPDGGATLGGANVAVGQTSVTVVVNQFPVPTAQVSIFVFNDDNPINNNPDPVVEEGLEGFTVIISDAGGQMIQDAFGNPIGTTYRTDVNGDFLFNPDGSPQVDVVGSGVVITDAEGKAFVKYIPPGKYGVVIVPPTTANWIQTTTIEGSPTIDAWVKGDNPPLVVEFGPAFNHIFMGFVNPDELPWALTPRRAPALSPAGWLTTISRRRRQSRVTLETRYQSAW
jgi:hypothetical protein